MKWNSRQFFPIFNFVTMHVLNNDFWDSCWDFPKSTATCMLDVQQWLPNVLEKNPALQFYLTLLTK